MTESGKMSTQNPENDGADLPVGLRSARWPTSSKPIEFGEEDTFYLRLEVPRNLKRLPDHANLLVRVGNRTMFDRLSVTPAELLGRLAKAWKGISAEVPREATPAAHKIHEGPRLAVRRDGSCLRWSLGRYPHFVAVEEVDFGAAYETLEMFGNALALRLDEEAPEYLAWCNRLPRQSGGLAQLEADLADRGVEELRALGIQDVPTADEIISPGDLRMAARLVGPEVQLEPLKQVFDLVRRCSPVPTPELDDLSDRCAFKKIGLHQKPWESGQKAASWVREELRLGDSYIDIESLLRKLNVQIETVDLSTSEVDAIAAWGDFGPVVVVNSTGRRAGGPAGRRATLAHELGHLVLDRDSALPVAEAQGYKVRTRGILERRANAFAAELLLPQRRAASELRQSGDVAATVEYLEQTYLVSRSLILWQLINHPDNNAGPTIEQRSEIDRMLDQVEQHFYWTSREQMRRRSRVMAPGASAHS